MHHSDSSSMAIHDGSWHILIAGLAPVQGPLTLAPGVTLRGLDSPLSVFDLAAAGVAGFQEWAVLEPIATACCNEIEATADSAVTPGYNTLNRAWLAMTLLGLRGFTRHLSVARSSYSWGSIAGSNPGPDARVQGATSRSLESFTGGLLDFRLKMLSAGEPLEHELTDKDALWVRSNFSTANTLASSSQAFRFALEAASDWRFATDSRAGIARLWSGVEALFDIRTELVYRLSILLASLLEERGSGRIERFAAVKRLYSQRSKAVHGAPMKEGAIADALDGSLELLTDLLRLIIERGEMLSDEEQLRSILC